MVVNSKRIAFHNNNNLSEQEFKYIKNDIGRKKLIQKYMIENMSIKFHRQ